jgi:hypothetical protein
MGRRFLIPLVISGFVLAGIAASASAAAGAKSACAGSMVVKTKSYLFAASLEPFQQMYTPAQVKAKQIKTGEVMVSGQMMGMHVSMSSQRHLEIHICSRSTGKVVTGAHPVITFVDEKQMGKMKMENVPAAAMYSIKLGRSDYHYGNNVTATAGHTYEVTVKLNRQTANFKLKATPSPPMSSSIAGTWSGQYSGAFSGTFTLTWTQSGSRLSGSITLSNPSGKYGISGSVQGGAIKFGAVGVGATYTGKVSGTSMSGSFKSPQGSGTWSAHKT